MINLVDCKCNDGPVLVAELQINKGQTERRVCHLIFSPYLFSLYYHIIIYLSLPTGAESFQRYCQNVW